MAQSLRSRALPMLAFALVTPLLLAGCGGGDDAKKSDAETPAQVMTAAKKKFDDASSVHIGLATEAMPSAGNGVLGASGDLTHDPAFEGDVKVALSGLTLEVPVTSIGGKVYAKLPPSTTFSEIKPSEYGAPDPADFVDPEDGLSGLLTKLEGLKKGSEKRSGDMILTTYTGTLPGAAVKKIIPSAVAKETYETSVGVDDKGFARTVKVTGPFFSGTDDVTYDVKFTQYGAGVKITTPES